MAITRTQIARQLYDNGGDVLGPLGEEDNLQSGFISGVKNIATPGNIGRGLAFVLSGGLTSVPAVAKEIAKQKAMDTIMKKSGDIIRPKIQTELMQRQNEITGTGGYQSDFGQDSGFMGGSGTAAEMGSFADGGRIGYQEGGGIESRLEQLGGDVSSAEKLLQGINQRLKTAESSLGSGGGGLDSIAQPFNPGNFQPTIPADGKLPQNPLGPTAQIPADPFGDPLSMGPPAGYANQITAITLAGQPMMGGLTNNKTPGFSSFEEMMKLRTTKDIPNFYYDLEGVRRDPQGNLFTPKPGQLPTTITRPRPGIGAINFLQSPQQDPYKNTQLAGLNQDGQRFDSAQSAFDALAEQTRKYREVSPQTRDVFGTELFQGAEGFKNFTNMFNEINDPNYVAPSPQLLSAQGNLGIPAAGYAEGGNVVGGEYDFESARQMYGLGKLVKKVTRSVKKIAKSPIGKAALLYAGTAGLGALGAGATRATTGFGGIFNPGNVLANLGKTKALFTNKIFGDVVGPGKTSKSLLDLVGGKIGLGIAGTSAIAGALTPEQEEEAQTLADSTGIDIEQARNSILAARRDDYKMDFRARGFRAEGGPAEGKEPVAKKTMPLLDMDGQEMDLRAEGGFVPIGRMEKADDVPARLSKNEFVFTADAVRNAGEGDVDKGAEVMYNMMKNLESGGDVSEESQGLDGARKMFQTSQRLEEVL